MTEDEFVRTIVDLGFYPLGGYTARAAHEFAHRRLNMLVDLHGLRRRAAYRNDDPYLSALAVIGQEAGKLSAIDRLAVLGDLPTTGVEQEYEQQKEAGHPDEIHRAGVDGPADGGSASPLRAQ